MTITTKNPTLPVPQDYITIDGLIIPLLPDCPLCGENEWTFDADLSHLICTCGIRINNDGLV